MALVVDSGGKVTANPDTGRIFNNNSSEPSSPFANFGSAIKSWWNQQAAQNPGASSAQTQAPIPSVFPMNTIPQLQSSARSIQQQDASPMELQASPMESQPPVNIEQNPFLNTSFDELREGFDNSLLKPLGVDFNRESGLDVWEQEAAKNQGREVRVANLFDEPYDMDGGDGKWLDNQLSLLGNTPVNDTYARYFADKGASLDDVYAITHKPQSLDEEEQLNEKWNPSPGIYDGTVEMLDDGTYNNYWKLTADAMTGTQYRNYRDELGMGGREDIDPTQVYSKRREEINYGFKPFTPDMSTYYNMVARNVLDIPARAGRAIGSAREYFTPDYSINYNDNEGQRSISGKEFDKRAPAFMGSFYYDRQFNPDKFLSEPTDGSAYTTLVNQFRVPDRDGNDTYHYGHLVDASAMPDGSIQFSFSDGSTVNTSEDFFKSVYDGKNVNIIPDIVPLQSAAQLVNLDNMGPDKHQAMINESVVPNENGENTYHYGNLISVDNGPNGTYAFTFEDGSTVNAPADFFESVYDPETRNINVPFNRVFLDDIKGDLEIKNDQEKPTLDNADVRYMPDLVMSDGTRISLEDVERLYLDQTPENDEERKDKSGKPILSDDDINYQFRGLLGIPFLDGILNNRPSRLGGQEIFKDNDFIPDDLSNVVNDAVDWSLGSLPISAGKYLPWIYSASSAGRALDAGIDPNTYDVGTDSYGLIAGGYDNEGNLRYGVFDEDESGNKVRNDKKSKDVRMSSALGNFVVPLTEQIVGPVGEQIIPLEKIAGKIPMKSAMGKFLRNEIVGAIGEGVEEVLGNIFEEGTQYGPDMFADPVIDNETNEPIRDQYGHEKRNENTPIWKRANNFLMNTGENLNALAGGMLVDANMRLLPRPIGGAIGDFRRARKQDKVRHATGLPLYVDPNEVENAGDYNRYAGLLDDEDELAASEG